MKPSATSGCLAAAFLAAITVMHAQQQLPVGHAVDFTSHAYFEPPNQQKVKIKISGAEALPLPDGLTDLRQLRIETFNVAGQTEAIIEAPQCNYALFGGIASSPGRIELQTGDGKLRVEGEGFLWRQTDNSLTISNNVHTVIKTGIWKPTKP